MSAIVIAGRRVSDDVPPFVIAEIGLNHGGSLPHALALVDGAADAGAHAIKLQTIVATELVAPTCPAPAHVTAASLVDFFVTGKASKDKRTKDLLPEYLRQVQKIAGEIKKEEAGKKGEKEKRPKTEAEEDAMFRDRHKGYKEKEKRLLEESFQRTFVGWDADDWKKFEEAYLKSL